MEPVLEFVQKADDKYKQIAGIIEEHTQMITKLFEEIKMTRTSIPRIPPGVHLDYGQSVAYQAADALASSTSNDVLLCQALELELAIQRAETVLGDFKVTETDFDGPEICFEYLMFDGEDHLLCEPVTVPVPTSCAKLVKFGDYDEDEYFAEPGDKDSGNDSDYERFESYMRQEVGDAEFERTWLDG